ncbi:14046_t:CDS:2, partial [Gigaspora margarita]
STSTNITQNPINRQTTLLLTQPTNINPFNFNDNQSLKIITHNVQGINTKLKFQLWLEKATELGAHIMSMTETKLPESTTPRSSLFNPLYTIFMANNNTSTGTVRENGEKLNKQWHNWNNIIKRTANTMILFTFSSPRKFHAYNLTMTKLYRALKIRDKYINRQNQKINQYRYPTITPGCLRCKHISK